MLSGAEAVLARLTRSRRIIDCHLHVIGDGIAHPYVADAAYRPSPAPLDRLLAMHSEHGIGRAVLVQVSVHGTDNGLMVDALRQSAGRFRGVAVVGPAPDEPLLAGLAAAGVVGLRLNLAHGGGPGLDSLERTGAICRELGWHLQLFADGRTLPSLAGRLQRLRCPLVFDHFGGVPAAFGRSHPAAGVLLDLVRAGAWVKLSGPYRVSAQTGGFEDTIGFGQDLLAAGPERCLWGTDWPHVASGGADIGLDALIGLVPRMAGEHTEALLVTNAERLYGFAPMTD